jgi:cell division inhibitor SepF
MALGMLDKLTNYLMPMEDMAAKKQVGTESDMEYGSKPNLQIHTNQSIALKIVVVSPAKYDDVRTYADHLKANIAVVLNLTGVEMDMQYAIKDFMNGASYILAGNVQRIADSVFMYTPSNVGIDKELYAYSVPTYVKPKSI